MQKWTDRAKKCVPYLFLIIIPVLNFWLLEWFSHDPFQTMKPYVQWLNVALFWFSALFLFGLTGRVSRALGIQTAFCAVYGLAFQTMKPYVQWLNVALFWFSALFLFGLTGRVSRALGIQTAFCAVYGLANYFVLEFRGAPIQPWDILSIGTAASVADNYEYRLDKDALTALIGLLVLLAAEFFLRATFSPSARLRAWQTIMNTGWTKTRSPRSSGCSCCSPQNFSCARTFTVRSKAAVP